MPLSLLETARHPERLWHDLTHSKQPLLWLLAVAVGTLGGIGAILFWSLAMWMQRQLFGADEAILATIAGSMEWWRVLLTPALGGLLIGAVLTWAVPDRRIHGVADVIRARIFRKAKVRRRTGLWSALLSASALGFGLSSGREGPIVHLGATISAYFARALGQPAVPRRVLLGCGVAAAVSASFNAPIAGVLFALEVVLGHYALSAFAPIVIASACGTIVSRLHWGDQTVFIIPNFALQSYLEVPAFALLGLVSALVAIIFMRSIFLAEDLTRDVKVPLMVRTTLGGLVVGAIALVFPQVLGIGYETTDALLREPLGFWLLVMLICAKTAATAATLASRAGNGVFAPSLYLGILTGVAFWQVAAWALPQYAAPHGLYALVGMGAVSAAVLGAPISTTLICFELTGNYQVALFVMIAASVSSTVKQYFVGQSFFHWQLERWGLPVNEGPERVVLQEWQVRHVMRDVSGLPMGVSLTAELPTILPDATLHEALTRMEKDKIDTLYVVDPDDPEELNGALHRAYALKVLTQCLLDVHAEEHR